MLSASAHLELSGVVQEGAEPPSALRFCRRAKPRVFHMGGRGWGFLGGNQDGFPLRLADIAAAYKLAEYSLGPAGGLWSER